MIDRFKRKPRGETLHCLLWTYLFSVVLVEERAAIASE
jgi:hypothetical protein